MMDLSKKMFQNFIHRFILLDMKDEERLMGVSKFHNETT